MKRAATFRIAAAGLLSPVLAAAPVGPSTTPAVAAPAPPQDPGPATPPSPAQIAARFGVDEEMAADIAADLELRGHLRFSTDPELAARLRMQPETADPGVPEIPMTSDEAAEFMTRQALNLDAERLEAALSERTAPTYAGVWLDNSTGQLAVTTTQAGLEQTTSVVDGAQLDNRDRIRIDVVQHSRRELMVVRQQLAPVVEDPEHESLPYNLTIDVSQNALVAIFPSDLPADEKARIETGLDQSGLPYRVETERMPSMASGTMQNDADAPPVVAGHGIIVTDNTASSSPGHTEYCTMAFKMRRTGFSTDFGLTAAHCFYEDWDAPVDSKVYYRGVSTGNIIGATEAYRVTASWDLGLVEYAGDTPSKIITNANTNVYRGINYIYDFVAEGVMVCAVGARSNNVRCGPMDDWSDGGQRILADIPERLPGDSGGPIYIVRPNNMAGAVGVVAESNGDSIRASNLIEDLDAFCPDCTLVGS